MQKNANSVFVGMLCFFLILSCNSNAVYDSYKTLPNQWHKDSIVNFNFTAPDTINPYNLHVNLRNNNGYKYNNLFVIVALHYPNGKIEKDTLEYKMAAPNGELLGTGFSDIKENKLWYKGFKAPFKFTEVGEYSVRIQHAMRNNGDLNGIANLEGVTEVGFCVEHTLK